MSRQRLVIIGNGMVAGRMLEHMFEHAPDVFDVTIFNAEPRVNYDRIMLSPVLAGEKSFEDIVIHDDAWYATHGVTLHRGERVDAIDRTAKSVTSSGGITAGYDKLVIATGSTPVIIPLPGRDLPGVLAYRDLDDVNAMLDTAAGGGHAVVIGGGLLGLEAAWGLKARGMAVTVVHLMPTLMERQLDPAAGYLLQKALAARGIDVCCGANTKALLGQNRVEAVELEDGTVIPCSLVVMAVGIRPNVALAQAAGLRTGRGIIVDARLRTSDPSIWSVGECVEIDGRTYGLVAPLYDMAKVAALGLVGKESARFGHAEAPAKLKVTGINLYSMGDITEAGDREEIVLRDAARGIYKRVILKDDRIVGAVLYGDTADGAWFNELMKKGSDIKAMRETLILGQAHQGAAAFDPVEAVAALPDDAEICGCNGVCKGRIAAAITEKGLTSLEDVRAQTKASSSCGTCTGLVENLMAALLGDAFARNAVKPLCGCTSLPHADVRRLIRAKRLKSIPAVMQELAWSTSSGCAKCRPALNYYLLSDWPGEYADDQQSRFVNERVHANIQKDGTYSVVPRMWGGMTSAAELRAIADVTDKYQIPAVKVTGGQRIDLLGVKKEDLPAVWADLGMAGLVSGHAYAKGLRTVKTCVGSTWCRFGTQDSTGLGIRLEKFLWGSWTPAKVKLAVSGCPRNCAEATCKDVGVICVDSGYEIHFAGAAGLEIMGTQVLGLVRTEEEVIEAIAALIQMYREQGFYLERIYRWAKRVGYDEVRRQIFDEPDTRRAYFDRFVVSQRFAQSDPWSERVSGKDKHEFRPMSSIVLEAAE